ncbi:hypothetical protein [Undibacterium sp. TS12]|uniref:hypothetical protein n=1 Tax=Undibacterium sp. TS12 TaxID=2908202 RepID=UPI001F4CE5E6|nr:hypothetical protein [Undibacterium sp. TS12]MCH8622751.1 hypothetical protein [Undibacterium sp. TS12]
MNDIIKLIEILRWPVVLLIIYFCSKESIFSFISKYRHVEINSSVAKIILKRLEVEQGISSTQIKKLRGLTGHDLWALNSFIMAQDPSYKYVHKFNPARKAMVFSFVEMGLLEISGEGENRRVKETSLATEVLNAANNLML